MQLFFPCITTPVVLPAVFIQKVAMLSELKILKYMLPYIVIVTVPNIVTIWLKPECKTLRIGTPILKTGLECSPILRAVGNQVVTMLSNPNIALQQWLTLPLPD